MTVSLAGGQVALLFLTMLRCTGLVIAAPIYGHHSIPALVKFGVVGALACAATWLVADPLVRLPGVRRVV